MTKRDDEQQDKIAKEYAETGVVPEGWQLDPVAEAHDGPRFRRIDTDGGDEQPPAPTGTGSPLGNEPEP